MIEVDNIIITMWLNSCSINKFANTFTKNKNNFKILNLQLYKNVYFLRTKNFNYKWFPLRIEILNLMKK